MSLKLSTAARNAVCDAVTAKLTAGSFGPYPGAVITVYTGTRPASPDNSPAGGTVGVASFALGNSPGFDPAVGGVAQSNDPSYGPPYEDENSQSGTAVWFRMTNRETALGVALIDGSVGVLGSGADLEFDSIVFNGSIGAPTRSTLTSFFISVYAP